MHALEWCAQTPITRPAMASVLGNPGVSVPGRVATVGREWCDSRHAESGISPITLGRHLDCGQKARYRAVTE